MPKDPFDDPFGTNHLPSYSPEVFTPGQRGGVAKRKADQAAQASQDAEFEEYFQEQDKVKDPEPSPRPKAKLSGGKWLKSPYHNGFSRIRQQINAHANLSSPS